MTAAIYTVGIPTKNRTATLKRCVESYVQNAQAAGRKFEVSVVDGSDTPKTRNDNKAVLTKIKAQYGVPVFYSGPNEIAAFVSRLANSGVPEEVARFALTDSEEVGVSVGAARNAVLLDAAGGYLLGVDDDTVCEASRPPLFGEDFYLKSSRRMESPYAVVASDPMSFWFYPDREAAYSANSPDPDVDVLGVMGEYLGLPQGNIQAVQMGLVGDAGMGSSTNLLLSSHLSHIHLNSSTQTYEEAMQSRAVLRAPVAPSVGDGAFFLSHSMALDLRTVLPPFFPVQTNADGMSGENLFGVTLRATSPASRVLHLPWALKHDPPEDRAFDGAAIVREASQVRLYDVVSQVTLGCIQEGREGYDALGDALVGVGGLSEEQFDSFLAVEMEKRRAAGHQFAQRYLDGAVFPLNSWLAGVRQVVDAYEASAENPAYSTPADLLEGRTASEARALAKTLLLKYGELLQSWERMFSAAKTLRMASNRVGIPL